MWEQAGVGAWIITVLEHWVGKAWEERKNTTQRAHIYKQTEWRDTASP